MGTDTSSATGSAPEGAEQPLLRIVRGDATEAEVAAVVSVLLASRVSDEQTDQKPQRGGWIDRSRALRSIGAPGRGAWVASARTR